MYKLPNRRKVRKLRKMSFWRRRKTNLVRPRLCVFKSSRHIQVQLINDNLGNVVACASSVEAAMKKTGLKGKSIAQKVGLLIAERAKAAGVSAVVFDRNGFTYHGRIKALAESAREGGLDF